jgi:hypothetical protein
MTTPAGEPHLDLVPEHGALVDQPAGSPAVSESVDTPPDAPGAETPDVEAERDKWRERAVVWRERALASELIAKELGAHLNDVKENLEDVRLAMRELVDQRSLSAPRPAPYTGWRAYVARLLDLDH